MKWDDISDLVALFLVLFVLVVCWLAYLKTSGMPEIVCGG